MNSNGTDCGSIVVTDDPDLSWVAKRLEQLEPRAPVAEQVQHVVDAITEVLHVDGVALALLDDASALQVVAANDDAVATFVRSQCDDDTGPIVDAVVRHAAAATNDLSADPRWDGAGARNAATAVRAALAVPVKIGGVAVGSLAVFRDDPHEWQPSEHAALDALATIVEGIIAGAIAARRQDQLVAQLQRALDSRVVIERAVGYVMGVAAVDAVAAFNLLRTSARASRTKVATLAADVLAGRATVGDARS